MNEKTLVAIAWPYVNGDLHLGHLAGYLLPADIFARFKRLRGDDVLMVSGSDCNGTPITVEADKEGKTPAEIVKIFHAHDVALFKQYSLSYNLYTTTVTDNHKKVTQELFMDLLKNGFIVKDISKQYYSEKENKFLPDRYVEGTCPHCGAEEQRSDQCEKCGRWLLDGELVSPYSKMTKSRVILKETEHYFLDLTNLSIDLKKYVKTRKGIWRDWVFAEALGWIEEGLQKRAITRDLDWGVDIPVKEIGELGEKYKLKSFEGKKIYVWFEAVIGYLSAAVEWSGLPDNEENFNGIFSRTKGQSKNWKDWWINENAKHFYFMGQDNLIFHTLMWPGELIGAKKGYTLPYNVVINKFMNYEGKKFSKSRNWTIDSKTMADKYGVDLVRFAIASNLPENKEANFTWKGFVEVVNNELVANLGNFVNRTLKFLESKMEGEVNGKVPELEPEVVREIKSAFEESAEFFEKAKFMDGIQRIMSLSRFGNQYFDKHEIWRVIKDDTEEARKVMLNLMNIVSALNILMGPVTIDAATKLGDTLKTDAKGLQPEVGVNKWTFTPRFEYKLAKPVEILFTKLELEKVLSEKA